METKQIEYFLAACETLNFTRAAESLDVAVPTLTRSIGKLEHELGGHLFRRERHLTHLTELGRMMQTHLAVARDATLAAKSDAQKYVNAETQLRIGVVPTMSANHLIQYLSTLRQTTPLLSLDIWEGQCADITGALDNSEIDIAIMSSPEYSDWYRAESIFLERYLVAFPTGHRFEKMEQIPLAEFEGEDYIKRLHCDFPSNFIKLGITKPYTQVRQRYSTEREDWVQLMVASGLGMTLMPEFLPILPGILTRPLVEPEVTRTLSIVTRRGRQHTRPVSLALDCARDMDWQNIQPISVNNISAASHLIQTTRRG